MISVVRYSHSPEWPKRGSENGASPPYVSLVPYVFILGAGFFRANTSVISLCKGKGFQPSPGAPWVPFKLRNAASKKSHALYGALQTTTDVSTRPIRVSTVIPSLPVCPIGQAVREDDGIFKVVAAFGQSSRGWRFHKSRSRILRTWLSASREAISPDTVRLDIRYR